MSRIKIEKTFELKSSCKNIYIYHYVRLSMGLKLET